MYRQHQQPRLRPHRPRHALCRGLRADARQPARHQHHRQLGHPQRHPRFHRRIHHQRHDLSRLQRRRHQLRQLGRQPQPRRATRRNFGGAISGLPTGTVRYFRAFASNATGGTWAPVTSVSSPPTAAPGGLTPLPQAARQPLVERHTRSGELQLKRASTNGGPYTTMLTGILGTIATDPTATAGSTQYYVVSASNAGGESANSAELAVSTLAAPATLTATAGNNSVALSWSAVAGATSYTVKRATTSGGPFTTLASGLAGTSHNDATALNGTTYFYVVTAINACFESAPSYVASATPSASIAAPTGLAGTPASTAPSSPGIPSPEPPATASSAPPPTAGPTPPSPAPCLRRISPTPA